MKITASTIVLFVILGLSGCSSSQPKTETYHMDKGGMSSAPHEMKTAPPVAKTEEDEKDKGYHMDKGSGMLSAPHKMKDGKVQ